MAAVDPIEQATAAQSINAFRARVAQVRELVEQARCREAADVEPDPAAHFAVGYHLGRKSTEVELKTRGLLISFAPARARTLEVDLDGENPDPVSSPGVLMESVQRRLLACDRALADLYDLLCEDADALGSGQHLSSEALDSALASWFAGA